MEQNLYPNGCMIIYKHNKPLIALVNCKGYFWEWMCMTGVEWGAISDALSYENVTLQQGHPEDNCAYVWTLPVISDSSEATTTSMSASMTTWMCSALTMKTQCQKIRPNAMFCTWWTLMATAPVITLPKGSRGGSVIGRILQMDHWSSRKSSSSSRPSHWDLSSGQAGSISTSVSIERFTTDAQHL